MQIHTAVNMQESEVKKLSPSQMKQMSDLYKSIFLVMYIWEKKPFTNSSRKPLRVYFKFLHKAPPGRLVYRGIEPERLTGLINKTRIEANFDSEYRYITMLPLKRRPVGGFFV